MSVEREVIGKAKCLNCGAGVVVKRNIKNHLYYNCSFVDGGCGCQFQSRANDADSHLLNKLDKSDKKASKPEQVEQVTEKPAIPKKAKENKGYFAGIV